jgi:hypothetical protein
MRLPACLYQYTDIYNVRQWEKDFLVNYTEYNHLSYNRTPKPLELPFHSP